jgi:transcriptional regulator GlxA family with amidase domain
MRLLRTLEVLHRETVKVEAVALQTGYASKKNFHEVFKRTVGVTPTELQRLPQERARQVIETATYFPL